MTIFKSLNRERRTSVRSHDLHRTYRLQPVVIQLWWSLVGMGAPERLPLAGLAEEQSAQVTNAV